MMTRQPDLADLTARMSQQKAAGAFWDYALTRWRGQSVHELPSTAHHDLIKKASVVALTPGSNDPLLQTSTEFARLVEEGTVLGRVPGVQPAQPHTPLVSVGDEALGDWIGEGAPIPAVDLTVPNRLVDVTKLALMFTASRILLDAPGAARALQAALVRGLRRLEDTKFLSTDAAIAGARPAGILSAAAAISEGSPAGIDAAVELMFAFVSNGRPTAPAFIVSPRGALWLHLQHVDGGALFPGVGVAGGSLGGVPVIVSAAATNKLILIDGAQLAVWDGGLAIDTARAGSLQLLDNPTNSSATATATTTVSMYQTNSVALRVVRYLSWQVLSDDAAAYVELSALSGSPS